MTDDHWEVRFTFVSGPREAWTAKAVDARAGIVLWTGDGPTMDTAVIDLALNMADELESRARFLPDEYVNVQDRP
jgi:hypothetical protein